MANRYWVGGTGNWSDATNHWSDSSGGTPNASFLPTSSDNVYFDANSGTGTCTINATANCLDFDASASTVTTFAGSSALNVYGSFTFKSGATNSWLGNIVFKATSGTKTIDTNSVSFASNSFQLDGSATFQLLNDISIKQLYRQSGVLDANGKKVTINVASTTHSVYGGLTFYDLEILGGAYKTGVLQFTGNIEVTNTFTVTGNSATNRILVKSDTLGTARTITANAVSLTNVDFRDITGAGSATWSGTSVGNALGNSNITFTTPVTRYWVATSGGNWSATTSWSDSSGGSSGSSVPLCHDTVVFDANSITSASRTITGDMPIIPAFDFSSVLNSPVLAFSQPTSIFGGINLTGLANLTGIWAVSLYGRSNCSITTNGIDFLSNLNFYNVGATVTLQDNLIVGGNLNIYYGTVDFNDVDVNTLNLMISSSGSLYMGNGTVSLTGTSAVLNISTDTIYCENSTIIVNNTTGTLKTFYGGGKTYNILKITGDNVRIEGSNTFTTLNLNNAGLTNGTLFVQSTTQKISNFSTNGSSGNLVKIRSSSTTRATLNYTGTGVVEEDYIDIDYITGTPDNTWYVGTNSVDGGHNSQIYFTNAPVTVNNSRSAKITGQATTTDNRPAKITGKATTTNDRSAKLTGSVTTNNVRSAKLSGIQTLTNDRSAKITGKLTTTDNRPAKITGNAIATTDRDAKLSGIQTLTNDRPAKITGKATTNDYRNAHITGYDTANDYRSAKITGKETANDYRSAKLTGYTTATNDREAKVTGFDTANDNRSAKVIGKATTFSTRNAKVSGKATAYNARTAVITGKEVSNADRNAHLIGKDTSDSSRSAKIIGNALTNDTRSAKISGKIATENDRNAKIIGKDTSNDYRASKVTGKDTSNDTRSAKTHGSATANDLRSATLKGIETLSNIRNARLVGCDTSDTNRGATIKGSDLANSVRSAKVFGILGAKDTRNAKLTAQDTAQDTRTAKITGYDTAQDTRPAKLTGGNTGTSSRSALIVGKGSWYVGQHNGWYNRDNKTIGVKQDEKWYKHLDV